MLNSTCRIGADGANIGEVFYVGDTFEMLARIVMRFMRLYSLLYNMTDIESKVHTVSDKNG